MREVALSRSFFQGALSVEEGPGWLKPWRLPVERRHLFPSPDDGLMHAAEYASGVRMRFRTDSRNLRLEFLPFPALLPIIERSSFVLDLTRQGELIASVAVAEGGTSAEFTGIPAGEGSLELWFPPDAPIAISRLLLDRGAEYRVEPDPRPGWITYGSSITHCARAHTPARTWPAIVARRHGLNLTNLGLGGQCHLDPAVAMVIRDLPADLITLKLGINCLISGSLNARTFPAGITGMVSIIRERQPRVPIGLVSPIVYPPRETEPNAVGCTMRDMRDAVRDVCQRLTDAGDRHLTCYDGLEIFGGAEMARYSADQCHPDADGIEVQAEAFDRIVMSDLMSRIRG